MYSKSTQSKQNKKSNNTPNKNPVIMRLQAWPYGVVTAYKTYLVHIMLFHSKICPLVKDIKILTGKTNLYTHTYVCTQQIYYIMY